MTRLQIEFEMVRFEREIENIAAQLTDLHDRATDAGANDLLPALGEGSDRLRGVQRLIAVSIPADSQAREWSGRCAP